MTFASRKAAGKELGRHLLDRHVTADLVLGLPRGGVVVAAEVAHLLHLPLDVLVVRKIGHPRHREFAVGAMAEGHVIMLDEESVGTDPRMRSELDSVIAEEVACLQEYIRIFHRGRGLELAGKSVLLVDDGLATGATMQVSLQSVLRHKTTRCIVAVPVASSHAVKRLKYLADDVVALLIDPDLDAVGRYYERFDQTTDDEVLALLREYMPL